MAGNDRYARMQPRLLATLDTLESDAEIANVVRRIRQTAGLNAFAQLGEDRIPAGDIDLADSRREVMIRLRSLGAFLAFVEHPDHETAFAVHRTSVALRAGGKATEADIRVTLATVMRVLELLRDELRAPQAHVPASHHVRRGMAMLRETLDRTER